jgi:hypothetical protein
MDVVGQLHAPAVGLAHSRSGCTAEEEIRLFMQRIKPRLLGRSLRSLARVGRRGGVAPVIAKGDNLLETEIQATYRTICPLLTRMLARSAFHLNMNTVDDVEEVLHHSHLLEQLLFSPLTILQHETHVANLKLIALNF